MPLPKKKISQERANVMSADLKARLGLRLRDLTIVDNEIQEFLNGHFDIVEIDPDEIEHSR